MGLLTRVIDARYAYRSMIWIPESLEMGLLISPTANANLWRTRDIVEEDA